MTICNKCGDCCRAIVLPLTKKAVKERGDTGDCGWITKHLKRISRTEANRRVPGYAEITDYKCFFYECSEFDANNNICTTHNERPRMCKKFPWYDRTPTADSVIRCYPNCSYHEDLKTKGERR